MGEADNASLEAAERVSGYTCSFKFSGEGRKVYPLFLGEENSIDRIIMDGVIKPEVIGAHLLYMYLQLLKLYPENLLETIR